MTVGDLLPRLSGVAPTPEAPVMAPAVRDQLVTAIAHDSRDVARGTIFVAVRGQRFDGARFAPDAATRGAVLVVAASMRPDDARVPWFLLTRSWSCRARSPRRFRHKRESRHP